MAFNKPDITQLSALGSTVGDVYFPQTELLLPLNGSNGATSTSDLSNRNNTSSFSGNAQISTAQSKFGGSSLAFDGSGDKITIGDSYWNDAISTVDFTIEYWLRLNVQNATHRLITNYTGSTNGWGMYYSTNNYIDFFWYHSSSWYYLNNVTGGTKSVIPNDTWTHVAVTRHGDTWRLFLNGTAENTRTSLAHTIVSSSQNELTFGVRPDTGAQGANAYVNDLRITVGEARYTSNFTAPTTAHLTSAGDVNKQIIINSAADGVAIGTGGINQARIAKAWVNFDADPSVSIRQSYNVSSITDTATGRFTINFSTAMLDADYCFSGSGGNQTGTTSGGRMVGPDGTKTTSALPVRYVTWGSTGTRNVYDNDYHCLIVFGN